MLMHSEETISKVKRQPTNREEVLPNHISDRIILKHVKNSFNNNNLIKKWVEDLNRHFSKEYIQIANKHIKSCSISLTPGKIQIKSTLKNHHRTQQSH